GGGAAADRGGCTLLLVGACIAGKGRALLQAGAHDWQGAHAGVRGKTHKDRHPLRHPHLYYRHHHPSHLPYLPCLVSANQRQKQLQSSLKRTTLQWQEK
ncbi:unnamed protein product, partial [Closterium sp. NIES-54]